MPVSETSFTPDWKPIADRIQALGVSLGAGIFSPNETLVFLDQIAHDMRWLIENSGTSGDFDV